MTGNRKHVARLLGWAGLAPFAVLAAASHIGAPGWVDRLLVGYGLAILSFLAGTLWMGALDGPDERPEPLVASNVIVLAGLPAVVLPVAWASGWLAVLFGVHAVSEWRWTRHGQPGWYRRLRAMLSAVVIALLVVSALAAFSSPADSGGAADGRVAVEILPGAGR